MKLRVWRALTVVVLASCFLYFVSRGTPATADGPRPPWTMSTLKGTPTPPAPYAIRAAFPSLSFEKPTSLEELPDGRMLVSEFSGSIYTFLKDPQSNQKDLLLHIDGSMIWHAAADRQDDSQWQLLVCYSKGGTSHVSRFRVAGAQADPQSEEVILTWPAGGHNAGCLRFGTDGMLYISTGDGSGPNPPDGRTAAQDVSNLFGCILRIDIRRKADGKNYGVPADNPFVDLKGARPEIWAYGLRNPWKFGIDGVTGNIFAADNGWESWEMVHQIVRGGNCGWPIMEGRAVLRSEVKQGPTPIRPPIKDHSHAEANSVIGGPVYRGTLLPDLNGTFVYGDYITGTIWGLKSDGEDSYTHSTLVDTDQRITAFAEGSAGELFVLDYDSTGQIYELVPSGLKDTSADFPRRLSETGLFTSLETMTPAPGVVPYEVVAQRWVDGATAERWVAVPGSEKITLATDTRPAVYPDGTVFVRHLTLRESGLSEQPIRLETQLLQYDNGVWHPYSYLWAEDAKDAALVDASGTQRELQLPPASLDSVRTDTDGRTWYVNAGNECRMCHDAGAGVVLGFTANQLNKLIPTSGTEFVSQIERLAGLNVTTGAADTSRDRPERLVDPHDSKESLDDRARSYLHANCSSCHHPGGNAIVSFYLRREMPFDQLQTNKGTGIGTFGIRNAKLIVPGDPYRSVLFYRMAKLGYARMPYIGSKIVDSRGVALIEEWIRAMPHEVSELDSMPVREESGEHLALRKLKLTTDPRGPGDSPDPTSIDSLLSSTEGALAVVAGIHGKTVRNFDVMHAYQSKESNIRGLFETFVPEPARRRTLGRSVNPESVLSLDGNASRGRLIFFSDGARCRDCHDRDDAGKSIGPTLAEIRKKYERRSEMLTHVLQPSLKVDEKFATWVVVTQDGKAQSGLIHNQDANAVVLKTADRKTIRIARSEIDEMQMVPQSLMPEGILSDLTAQEAADLLAWFGSTDD